MNAAEIPDRLIYAAAIFNGLIALSVLLVLWFARRAGGASR